MAQKGNEISASWGDSGVSSPGQDTVVMRKASTAVKPNISAKNVACSCWTIQPLCSENPGHSPWTANLSFTAEGWCWYKIMQFVQSSAFYLLFQQSLLGLWDFRGRSLHPPPKRELKPCTHGSRCVRRLLGKIPWDSPVLPRSTQSPQREKVSFWLTHTWLRRSFSQPQTLCNTSRLTVKWEETWPGKSSSLGKIYPFFFLLIFSKYKGDWLLEVQLYPEALAISQLMIISHLRYHFLKTWSSSICMLHWGLEAQCKRTGSRAGNPGGKAQWKNRTELAAARMFCLPTSVLP